MAQIPQKPGVPKPGGQQLSEFESGKEKLASERLEDLCGEMEEELEEVKVKYEMYFLGVERMEPSRRRDDLKRNINRLRTAFTRNAGVRFRIQALHARYLAYERLWLRSAREKEAGTYRRDLLRARRRRSQEKGSPPGGAGRSLPPSEDVDLSDFGEAETPSPVEAGPPPPEPAAPPRPTEAPQAAVPSPREEAKPPPTFEAPSGGMGEGQMRALFDAYVEAKVRCHEDVSRLTYDSLAKSVKKQIPEIVARYNAREVEFKVVIKDGKAVLRAVPRS
ncbi:MAG TPA: MXAN_5187 C-terminal domain-containing protein [Anaeromyxobacteraceae bacterium]|nr:MXAN_5187 C-terminal domain-containing protein [Anaeromyxobacteraceae bacterium]